MPTHTASSSDLIPAPVVARHGRFLVVRDDLLPGGSKVRYMLPLVAAMPEREICYASPAVGYAQMALAHVCAMLGKRAVIFVAKRATPHPRTLAAKAAGATIYQVPHGYLSNVQAKAKRYAADTGARVIPWGVDLPEALAHFAEAARRIDVAPREVWACAGSGALIRGLQLAWPDAEFHAVQIGAVPKVGRATLHKAPEKYEDAARRPPPWPSCDNYDAKVWQFASARAADNALIWNVGA
jgi:Pyridoxal-phosphate dependent enzyme